MRALFLSFCFAILLSGFASLLAESSQKTGGTLIITYQTGLKGERLDRVRFWLRKKNSTEKQLYPARNSCAENLGKLARTVVVENLSAGDYSLEFVIPNRDAFFMLPSPKDVKVTAGEVVKINQTIKPRYAALKVAVALADQQKKFPKTPLITLHGAEGDIISYSSAGELATEALSPGRYTLIFENLPGLVAPSPMEFQLKPEQSLGPIEGVYREGNVGVASSVAKQEKSGTVLLFYSSNQVNADLKKIRFRIKTPEEKWMPNEQIKEGIQFQMKEGVLAILRDLPIGRYEIEFFLKGKNLIPKVLSKQVFDLKGDEVKSIKMFFPQEEIASFKVALKAYQDKEHSQNEIAFTMNPKALQPAILTVQNNRPNTAWSLYRRSLLIYSGSGSVDKLKVPPGGPYVIKPEQVDGYKVNVYPKSTFNLDANSSMQLEIHYEKVEEGTVAEASVGGISRIKSFGMEWVPSQGGKTILGDPRSGLRENEMAEKLVEVEPFEIGKYPVTNAEYAVWLNLAMQNKKITLQNGMIKDLAGYLLCTTVDKDPLSQIVANQISGKFSFTVVANKSDHPVINVSWYGAKAFCEDYQARLPTEAEWENAAGMTVVDGKPQKFLYGFSQNAIDPAWANYKASDRPFTNEIVLTTPVGFFNGENKRTFAGKELLTHNAHSPVGAYDMSGNVWEWTEGGSKQQVVKGGCYDSLSSGVRVAERLALDPDHVDIYTGFRLIRATPAMTIWE